MSMRLSNKFQALALVAASFLPAPVLADSYTAASCEADPLGYGSQIDFDRSAYPVRNFNRAAEHKLRGIKLAKPIVGDVLGQYIDGYGYPAYSYARDAIMCEISGLYVPAGYQSFDNANHKAAEGYQQILFELMFKTATSIDDIKENIRFLETELSPITGEEYLNAQFLTFIQQNNDFFSGNSERAQIYVAYLNDLLSDLLENPNDKIDPLAVVWSLGAIAMINHEFIPNYLAAVKNNDAWFEDSFRSFFNGLEGHSGHDGALVPVLLSKLDSQNLEVQRIASSALGTILGQSPELREPIMRAFYNVLAEGVAPNGENSLAHHQTGNILERQTSLAGFRADQELQIYYLDFWMNLLENPQGDILTADQARKLCQGLNKYYDDGYPLNIRVKIKDTVSLLKAYNAEDCDVPNYSLAYASSDPHDAHLTAD